MHDIAIAKLSRHVYEVVGEFIKPPENNKDVSIKELVLGVNDSEVIEYCVPYILEREQMESNVHLVLAIAKYYRNNNIIFTFNSEKYNTSKDLDSLCKSFNPEDLYNMGDLLIEENKMNDSLLPKVIITKLKEQEEFILEDFQLFVEQKINKRELRKICTTALWVSVFGLFHNKTGICYERFNYIMMDAIDLEEYQMILRYCYAKNISYQYLLSCQGIIIHNDIDRILKDNVIIRILDGKAYYMDLLAEPPVMEYSVL